MALKESSIDRQLISEYLEAFKEANQTVKQLPTISYSAGWYTFQTPGIGTNRWRKAQVIVMRDTLLKRIADAQNSTL